MLEFLGPFSLWSFLLGFLAAGILGTLSRRLMLDGYIKGMADQPLFPPEDSTPADIVRRSRAAAARCVVWRVLYVAVWLTVIWGVIVLIFAG